MSQASKYENKNKLHQYVLNRFLEHIAQAVEKTNAQRIIEIGCADGYVYDFLSNRGLSIQYTGVDIDSSALARAQRQFENARFMEGDILDIKLKEQFDMVMVLEVLEHVEQYEHALLSVKQINAKHFLLSVPHEPYFRALNFLRGRHWKRLGNHPEHINTWRKKEFKDIISKHFKIEEDVSSFPWTILLVSKYE